MTTVADLEALEPEWDELWRHDTRATPFQSPAWLIPWTKHLWGGGELLIFEEREAAQLTGLLLLFRWGTGQTTVSFLGAGVSDYGDILGKFRNLDLPPDASLEEVRESSPVFAFCRAEPCSVSPVLKLFDYPAALDPKLKIDLRRSSNKLAKYNPAFTLTTDPSPFFALYAKRWKAERDPALELFQCEAAAEFAKRNLLRLHLLTLDGQPAAAIFGIAAHGTLYCYLSAFDPQFTKLSPGALLLAHAIDAAKSEGCQEIDFLRGSEPYKYLWGAKDRTNYRVRPGTNTAISREQPGS